MDVRHDEQLARSAKQLTDAHPGISRRLISTLLRVAYHDLAETAVVTEYLPLLADRRIADELAHIAIDERPKAS